MARRSHPLRFKSDIPVGPTSHRANVPDREPDWAIKWFTSTSNGINLGLFQVSFSTFWLIFFSQKVLKLTLKSPRFVPFDALLAQLGDKSEMGVAWF